MKAAPRCGLPANICLVAMIALRIEFRYVSPMDKEFGLISVYTYM